MFPGPPYAITSTAICSAAMDEIHDGPHRGDVRLRKDAVAEIEDVARTSAGAGEDVANLTGPFRRGSEQGDGLEVALDRSLAGAAPAGIQRTPPSFPVRAAPRRSEVISIDWRIPLD